MSNSTPTLKAAVKYALDLQRKADQERARDPWASPYRPTEASVRKLASRMAGEATRNLPVDATLEQVEEAKASGPARAMAYMSLRAKQHTSEYAEQNEIADRSMQRLKRRQAQARKERDYDRQGLSSGQRIDGVIARLRVVAAPSAVRVGRETPGSERDMRPAFCVDASSRAAVIAAKCVRELEELEDELRVRDLGAAA